MKLKFKHQAYQADAARAVGDCFQGQPISSGLKYAVDPGKASSKGFVPLPGRLTIDPHAPQRRMISNRRKHKARMERASPGGMNIHSLTREAFHSRRAAI